MWGARSPLHLRAGGTHSQTIHIIYPWPFRYISMSYIQSIYHIVFRTYRSERTINELHERELYAVIMEQTKGMQGRLIRIGGMPDHLHLLVSLPATMSVSQYVQAVKTFTSRWLRANPLFPYWNGWGREYAAISYNVRDKEMIANYIKGQKEHHRVVSFADEFRRILTENGVVIREEYFLAD